MIVEIDGLQIKFPFEPYPLQRDYMAKVIEALNSKQNAVLESPTGEILRRHCEKVPDFTIFRHFQEPVRLSAF